MEGAPSSASQRSTIAALEDSISTSLSPSTPRIWAATNSLMSSKLSCGGPGVAGLLTMATVRSAVGRIWQASRTVSGASMERSVIASAPTGGGRLPPPVSILTRQVEHRPRPPQTEACGMPAARLISSSVLPASVLTLRPPA
jgi:hypothetical protein